jgi:hypothetical protein
LIETSNPAIWFHYPEKRAVCHRGASNAVGFALIGQPLPPPPLPPPKPWTPERFVIISDEEAARRRGRGSDDDESGEGGRGPSIVPMLMEEEGGALRPAVRFLTATDLQVALLNIPNLTEAKLVAAG